MTTMAREGELTSGATASWPRRAVAMALLGFASGLPALLTGRTMQLWMRNLGIDLGVIGLFALVSLPYSLKFIWAPLLDRYAPPGLRRVGRRRGWLVVTQGAVVLAIAWMAVAGPAATADPLHVFAIAALVLAFASASQDIVADAYRTDLHPGREAGLGASVFVSGYRLAMIVAGSGAMILSGWAGWPVVYLGMAACMVVGIIGTAIGPPTPSAIAAPATIRDAVVEPLRELVARHGPRVAIVALFMLLFRLPDVLGGAMATMLLTDLKFTNQDIGLWQQAFGLGVSIPGAILGGVIVTRVGVIRSLWAFGILQALSNLGYMAIALAGKDYAMLIGVIALENLCGGLAAAGFMAFLMNQCDRRYSASQYALFTSLMAVANSLFASPMGYLAGSWGYPLFFAMTALAGAPGMVLIPFLRPRDRLAA
jgi:PAT family beta-lactamase induction signal transducer AmpG